jgi:hypothetical protein
MNYRYCLCQDGLALQRLRAPLLAVKQAMKQADGCEPRHVRCDRKRKRSFSGLSHCLSTLNLELELTLFLSDYLTLNRGVLLTFNANTQYRSSRSGVYKETRERERAASGLKFSSFFSSFRLLFT